MNCPRCGEPMRIVATDSGGAYFCPSCRGARERAILSDRVADAVIEQAKAKRRAEPEMHADDSEGGTI